MGEFVDCFLIIFFTVVFHFPSCEEFRLYLLVSGQVYLSSFHGLCFPFCFRGFLPLCFHSSPPQACALLPDYPDVLHLPLVSPPPLTCGFKPLHFHTEFAALLSWTSIICRFIAIFIHLFLSYYLSFLTNIFIYFRLIIDYSACEADSTFNRQARSEQRSNHTWFLDRFSLWS